MCVHTFRKSAKPTPRNLLKCVVKRRVLHYPKLPRSQEDLFQAAFVAADLVSISNATLDKWIRNISQNDSQSTKTSHGRIFHTKNNKSPQQLTLECVPGLGSNSWMITSSSTCLQGDSDWYFCKIFWSTFPFSLISELSGFSTAIKPLSNLPAPSAWHQLLDHAKTLQ
jgi:predicted  nucleic acid-binding Zn ribbon protein